MTGDTPTSDRPALRVDGPHPRPTLGAGPRPRALHRRMASLVPREARVLHLGRDRDGLAADPLFWGLDVDFADSFASLDGELARYDLALVPEALALTLDPQHLLESLRPAIRPGGTLLAVIPNPGLLQIREEIPDSKDPVADRLPDFHLERYARWVEESGFAVQRIEAIDEDRGDTESLPSSWVVIARVPPVEGWDWYSERLRESALARAFAEGAVRELTARLTQVEAVADGIHRRMRELSTRESETRSELVAIHEQLMKRDGEYLEREREAIERCKAAESGRDQDALHTRAFREALETWHSRSEEEFQESKLVLISERDAAHRQAIAAEARCRALENRLEHIVMETPRRIARKLLSRLRRGAATPPPAPKDSDRADASD